MSLFDAVVNRLLRNKSLKQLPIKWLQTNSRLNANYQHISTDTKA